MRCFNYELFPGAGFCALRIAAVLLTIVYSETTLCYESDQYSNRLVPVKDSIAEMDSKVNSAIQEVIRDWQGPRDELEFSRRIYHELGGLHLSDKIERWVVRSPLIVKYPQTRYANIYTGMSPWARRFSYFSGLGRTIRLNGVIVGSDKLGHFFSQGLKYFKRERNGWTMDKVMARGAFGERWLWGQATTGAFANADLVANYEGMLFFKSLFEADVVPGKGPLIGWSGNLPHQLRPFTWADHVNAYWDEALNPSFLTGPLNRQLRSAIIKLCDSYQSDPTSYIVGNDSELWARYQHVGLKDFRQNQFQQICTEPASTTSQVIP
jgi:hypothetical protein